MFPVSICCIERQGDELYARRPGDNDCWKINDSVAHFLNQLDGRTNPYAIQDCPFTHRQIRELLSALREAGLLLVDRWDLSLFSCRFTAFIAPKRFSVTARRACLALAVLLALVWIPMLIIGITRYLSWTFEGGGSDMLGIFVGMFAGLFFHEIAHAVSCVGLGGRFFDAGVMLQLLLIPCAFVEIDYTQIRSRAFRVQVLFAGVEMNLLQCGIGLCAMGSSYGDFWLGYAEANLVMALLNLGIFYRGFDGARALSELLGTDLSLSLDLLLDRRVRRSVHRKAGWNGTARIAVARTLALLQIGIVVVLILNFRELIAWIF